MLPFAEIYPWRLRFRLYYGSIFSLTVSPKAPTIGGSPHNNHNPAITCRFALSEQKYTSYSIPKFQTLRVYNGGMTEGKLVLTGNNNSTANAQVIQYDRIQVSMN